jgi:transcriptional regulator with XRE-family HTH domain
MARQRSIANKGLGERIRKIRTDLGLSSEAFGKRIGPQGVTGSAVRSWEATGNITTENLAAVAAVAGVNVDYLISGREVAYSRRSDPARRVIYNDPVVSERAAVADDNLIPIYSASDAGAGCIMLNNEAILERVHGPRSLWGRVGAYGVFVPTDAMKPVFRTGDVIWVDPLLPPTADAEVLLCEDAEPASFARSVANHMTSARRMICTLVAYDDNQWTVETLKPEVKRQSLPRAGWRAYRIVSKDARR